MATCENCGRRYTHASNGVLVQMSRPTQRAAGGLRTALFGAPDPEVAAPIAGAGVEKFLAEHPEYCIQAKVSPLGDG